MGSNDDAGNLTLVRRSRGRALLRPLLLAGISVAVGWIVIGLVGAIDSDQVATSLGQLGWWQAGPLLVALLVRQTLNAVPLTRFVPGLTLGRSMHNDRTANLVGTLAPPPGDVMIRVSMFGS